MPLLFVYGSLKRGFRLHAHLQAGTFRGVARTKPGYALYRLGWYPGMVAEATSDGVSGELYEVPETLLPVLDEVEGVPHLYQRTRITITCAEYSPETVAVFTYLYQQPVEGCPHVADGDWQEGPR